jgi:hypothetical protein
MSYGVGLHSSRQPLNSGILAYLLRGQPDALTGSPMRRVCRAACEDRSW